jgi:hypothetical protein
MMPTDTRYYLFSIEHGAWWKPNGWGYTTDLKAAGRYSAEVAIEICNKANMTGELHELPIAEAIAPELDLSCYFLMRPENDHP